MAPVALHEVFSIFRTPSPSGIVGEIARRQRLLLYGIDWGEWLGQQLDELTPKLQLPGLPNFPGLPNLPSLPAINETVPGVVSSGWMVLMAPAGTPEHIVQKVNADLRKVVAMLEVVERFYTLGTYTRDLTLAQTGEFMRSEERLWWPIVRQLNQQPAAPAR